MMAEYNKIVAVVKIPIKYQYYISMECIRDALFRLDYNPDTMYVQSSLWKLPDKPDTVNGIGFFKNPSDKKPDVVICTDQEIVYVLDDQHLNEISNNGEHVVLAELTFENVFDNKCTWTELKQKCLKERNVKS